MEQEDEKGGTPGQLRLTGRFRYEFGRRMFEARPESGGALIWVDGTDWPSPITVRYAATQE